MSSQKRLKAAERLFSPLVNDPLYVASLRERLLNGKLPPQVETLLLHYVHGKPVERVEVSDGDSLAALSHDELTAEIQKLETLLHKLKPAAGAQTISTERPDPHAIH